MSTATLTPPYITGDQLAQARKALAFMMSNLGQLADQLRILEEIALNPAGPEQDNAATFSTIEDAIEAGDMIEANLETILNTLTPIQEAAQS